MNIRINKLYILLCIVLFPVTGIAQDIEVYAAAVHSSTYTNEAATQFRKMITYYDGLGRRSQVVEKMVTPQKKDLLTLYEYNPKGNVREVWLPALFGGVDNWKNVTEIKRQARTLQGDEEPYQEFRYENSPLNRVTFEYGPGSDWHMRSKTNRKEYLVNVMGDELLNCVRYELSDPVTSFPSFSKGKSYTSGQLFVTRFTDEDANVLYVFENCNGQVVLERRVTKNGSTNVSHDTYYIYDDWNNLRAVLPPLASDALASGITGTQQETVLVQSAYFYRYNARQQCIAKKLPGAEWTYYVYDKADRVIFSQDGEQRRRSEWSFSIPDELGRAVVSGICKNSLTYTADPLKSVVGKATWGKATNSYKGYTISGVTLTSPVVLSVNYYDSYEFMGLNSIPAITDANFKPETLSGYGTRYTGGYKGMLTGTLTARLNGSTVAAYLPKAIYYDQYGRVIQIKANNHLTGGIDKEYIGYNFVGETIKRRLVHAATGKTTQTEVYDYTYDHAGRLTKQTHQLNSGTVITLQENTYDELGRLKTSAPAGQSKLKTTYDYNVRSWVTSIQSTSFKQNLYYNTSFANNVPQYGGNISGMSWQAEGDSERTYTFKYDNLSRLLHSAYNKIASGGMYNTSYSYDKHGNITKLVRRGKETLAAGSNVVTDDLAFTYTGNQLKKVIDSGTNITLPESADFKDYSGGKGEYLYDTNGALTKDTHKGVAAIRYNLLHLPYQIDIKNPVAEARNEYLYSADGERLKVTRKWNPAPSATAVSGSAINTASLTQTQTTDYIGNKVYENGQLKRVLVDGGYYDTTDKKYYFYLRDHQGNSRVVADQNGTVIQKTHYYPFGMAFAESTGGTKQPYKYNGKELDSDRGLNLYDYHTRQYEPATARFTTMDPLAENYYSISPYAYCGNNPVNMVDPDGRMFDWYLNEQTGELMFDRAMTAQSFSRDGATFNRIGGNDFFDNYAKGMDLQYFSAEGSLDFVKKYGYSIEPTQQLVYTYVNQTSFNTGKHKTNIELGEVTVINENYALAPLHHNRNEVRSERLFEKESKPWQVLFGIRYEMNVRRNTYKYSGTDKWKIDAMNTVKGVYGTMEKLNGIHDYKNSGSYRSWNDYSKATNNEGFLLKYKK